ncbi:pyruvate dehydrogenase (acetyl-transferring) E1 component subunit alpha [Halegenticoccus tardaugens]|uniref:pyruvate dehydrogenase (acetyl-transferring) E1 component subunit alpha n=1 Tax=Halegenticoccus tardaugens TaxID=2071624 RepID=UPI00100BF76D|nr:pyruvate dehydrogenase (acetyl-transferring) E1 component subunit alpha [Halegenticoccus tardaugens]
MSAREKQWDEYYRLLDENGRPLEGVTIPSLTDDEFVEMYYRMRQVRRFDERGISLQRQGRMGTFSTVRGHEGALIGSEFALNDDDWIVPYYRDHAATISHGIDMSNILMYYMGNEQGNKVAPDVNIFPICITIGGHVPHATGLSWASKLKGESKVFLCYFGDGATSEGDFHEGLNFAGVFDTPTIFFCLNNQWAISTPLEKQTASQTIAQKATAYGFEGVRVDGTDPLAVYEVTRNAVERARNADTDDRRPTLVEALLYRIAAHNTSDDPTVYRDEEEVEQWKKLDPISRFETFLRDTGRLNDEIVNAIETNIEDQVETAVEIAESIEPTPEEIFDYVFESQPNALSKQQSNLMKLHDEYGDDLINDI